MSTSFLSRFFVAVAFAAIVGSPLAALAAQGAVCSASDSSHCTPGQSCDTQAGHCISTTNQQCGGTYPACTTGFTCAPSHFCSPSDQTPSNDPNPYGVTGQFANPLKADSLTELLGIVLHAIVQLGAILLVLALVWVGFLFVAAQGAEEKIRDARSALVWTVIGGLILLGAEAISATIAATVQAL